MKQKPTLLFLIAATGVSMFAADDTPARIEKAVAVFNTMNISPQRLASADCIAVIPGFKKGAAIVGAGYGRGFISCRNGSNWSAPGALTLETGSLGVQLGGEEIDIVILSLDKNRRAKLLSDRFAIGSDASAAWGNGKSAHDDPNPQILFFGHTKGAFAGFGLDGATLKADESSIKSLYGKGMSNGEIVGGATTPAAAQPLIAGLAHASH
jgi:lipid-binding SYLF domain-containing protein